MQKVSFMIRINLLLSLIFFINFIYLDELSPDQIKKIEEVTQDVNKAPDFTLSSIQSFNNEIIDSSYTLSKMEDKVILINFWATWCGPCRLEIPDFNELYSKYNSRGFEILGVSISDTKDALLNFLKAYKIDYPVLYGKQNEMQKMLSDYGGIYSIPISILVDKNNQILRVYPGAILKQYDPNMYADLIYNIEMSIDEVNER
jgi:thiol-disulfide isomerase/thioredoxin